MPHSAHPPTTPTRHLAGVDLDSVLDADPAVAPGTPVVDAEILDAETVEHRIEDSPLYNRCRLQGRIVTNPAEREQIGEHIAYGRLRWYRRLFTGAPEGW